MLGIDAQTYKQSIDLRTFAERYSHLDKQPNSPERNGPCPVCGGSDRFYATRDFCGCRQEGWRTDVYGLVMRADHVTFPEAVKMVTGETLIPERKPAEPDVQQVPRQEDDGRRDYFLANAPEFAKRAHEALMSGGNAGADYLLGRGLEAEAWDEFGFGYTEHPIGVSPQWERPCIVMPWYAQGKVTALRYRYLSAINYTDNKGKQRTEKAHSCAGSKTFGVVYGGQALPAFVAGAQWQDGVNNLALGYRTLVLVEGEINAASIHQVCRTAHVDVLCFGSQGHAVPPRIADMAQQYRAVIVWMDEEEFVAKKLSALECGFGFWGTKDGVKTDANDYMQQGKLSGVMAALMRKATPAAHQERLRWDLEDGGLV